MMADFNFNDIWKAAVNACREADPMAVAIAAISGALVFLVLRMIMWRLHLQKMKMPLVKGGMPLLGQALRMIKTCPWDMMSDWCKEYGNVYQFDLHLGKKCVTLAEPALVREVLHAQMAKFTKDVAFTYRPFMALLGTGLVTSEGRLWRRQRALVSSAFRIEILREIPQLAKEAADRLGERLDRAAREGTPVEMAEEFRRLTLQVICEAILSLPPAEADATFATMYMPIVEEANKRVWYPHREWVPGPAWRAHRRHARRLNAYVADLVERRWALRRQEAAAGAGPGAAAAAGLAGAAAAGEAGARKPDILDKVMGALDPAAWLCNPAATVRQLRDEIKTFVLAGHETSASMLGWALFELARAPALMARARAEAQKVFGKRNTPESSLPAHEKFSDLVFNEACLKEALRRYSVVPTVVRTAAQDVTLPPGPGGGPGVFLARGTSVMIGIQAVHHRADLWPEPMKYLPDRFLGPVQPYTFLPFIDGPRACLGQNLSLLESKVVLATLVQRYSFTLVNEADSAERHPYMVPIIPINGLQVLVVKNK